MVLGCSPGQIVHLPSMMTKSQISKQINLEIKIIFGSLFCVIPTPPSLSLSLPLLSSPLSLPLSLLLYRAVTEV